MDVKRLIRKYLKEDGLYPRNYSFDYCYNYFYSFYKKNEINALANKQNMQLSCLQLGFYLASWGMFRPSSFLLQKNVKCYEDLIKVISKMDKKLWEIDVDSYPENMNLLLECKDKIFDALMEIASSEKKKPTNTQITKIMLGVFANIPAFDSNFINGMKEVYTGSIDERALSDIKKFYEKYKTDLDKFAEYTLDFHTSKKTKTIYTKAKLIDMCGWMSGYELDKRET